MTAPVLWFLLGAAFFGIEVISMTLVLIFFAVGAWAAAVAAWCGANFVWQIAAFMLCSLLTLCFLRRRLHAVFSGQTRAAVAEGGHPLTNRQGTVSKIIRPGAHGEICVGGSFWRAVADGLLHEGTPVRVLGCLPGDGLVLRVARTEETREEK
jgi:membrane protein implicated in regulation of membrane protease activity